MTTYGAPNDAEVAEGIIMATVGFQCYRLFHSTNQTSFTNIIANNRNISLLNAKYIMAFKAYWCTDTNIHK